MITSVSEVSDWVAVDRGLTFLIVSALTLAGMRRLEFSEGQKSASNFSGHYPAQKMSKSHPYICLTVKVDSPGSGTLCV